MWEYFLLDYMANVFFSGAKHMTGGETGSQDKKKKVEQENSRI